MSDDGDLEARFEFEPFRSDGLIPDDAVPVFGVRIVVYIDADGETKHDFEVTGEARLIDAMAALEDTKLRMWARQHGLIDEDDAG